MGKKNRKNQGGNYPAVQNAHASQEAVPRREVVFSTEKEIRLDEIAHFQKFLVSNGVTNTVLLGHADTRKRALDVEFPNEAPAVAEAPVPVHAAEPGQEPF